MKDPLSIASNGYLTKYKRTQSIAVDGYLSIFALMVVPISGTHTGYGKPKTKEIDYVAQRHEREEEEVLLFIKIFTEIWR